MFEAAARPIVRAGLGRAGEVIRRDPGCDDERRAGLLADPLHDVEDAGREAGLGGQVGQQRARQRRPLGRLQHHRAAGRQRRGRLPGREHERGVPGRDHDRRARAASESRGSRCRSSSRSAPRTLPRDRRRRGSCARPARSPAPAATRGASPCRRTRRWRCRSMFASIRSASRSKVDGSPGGAERSPVRERPLCRRHRLLDVVGAAAGDLCQDALVDRADVGERALAGHAAAVDEMVGRNGYPQRCSSLELHHANVEQTRATVDRNQAAARHQRRVHSSRTVSRSSTV